MLEALSTAVPWLLLMGAMAGAYGQPAGAAGAAPHPSTAAGDQRRSYDHGPELQRAPGGSLIVNAFIMEGPVRVEVRDRQSQTLLLQREADSLFPFEISAEELRVAPDETQVRIFVDGKLIHELELLPR